MKLAVTIDTEADSQWDHGVPLTTRNVAYWPRFQQLCDRYGVTPTYLLTSEIIADDRAREFLEACSKRGAAEIGAHLHPWTTPPFRDAPGLRYNDVLHAFASQLPTDLLREKVARLTEEFTTAFGRRPTSHRAGRFGFDARFAASLAGEGYVVDSSVSPQWSWHTYPGMNGEGGPDFRHHTPHPFLIGNAGERTLVEVPVTVLPTYAPLRDHRKLLEAYQLLPVRAARRLLLSRWLRPQPMWLTPDPRYGPADLASIWCCAAELGLDVTVMIIHSSEFMPGGSPFRRDAQSVQELLDCLDVFFAFVTRQGGEFSTLTPLASGLLAGRELVTKPL